MRGRREPIREQLSARAVIEEVLGDPESRIARHVELKPDNSRAVRTGQDQVIRYARELNDAMDVWRDELKKEKEEDRKAPKVLQNLWSKNSDFKKCKKFAGRVDCYKLCPQPGTDGETNAPSASWREGC